MPRRGAVQTSLPFGVYHEGKLVGFARVITDYATFAYVGDVFVLEAHRGRGLSKWLMGAIAEDPFGQPDRWMERRPVKGYVPGAPDPLAAPRPGDPRAIRSAIGRVLADQAGG